MTQQDEKKLLRANRDMVVLIDRELSRLRARNGPLAAASEDPDSFLPFIFSTIGSDDKSGIPLGATTAQQTLSGNIDIDGDAAFVATGWQAFCSTSSSPSTVYDVPLYDTRLFVVDARLVDVTANRQLTRGATDQTIMSTRFSVAQPMAPVVPLPAPFTLPRNTSLRVDLRFAKSFSNARAYFLLHGFKVFGD